MSEAVLPSLIDAFDESRRKHGVSTSDIADIGCGTGRFLKYLVRFGGKRIAVDKSPTMLRLARRRLQGTDTTFLRQDLLHLELPEPVETLTCTFDTINYLTAPGDLAKAFTSFARALRPGGTLLFDFIPEGSCPETPGVRQDVRTGNIRSQWRIRIDPGGRGSTVTILMRRQGDPGGPVYVEKHRQRWHATDEVRGAMKAAGLAQVDWRPAEPGGAFDWVHVVARRLPQVSL